MSNSLLAHLYSDFKSKPEDLATKCLCYYLKQSDILNSTFTKLVSDALKIDLQKTLQYSTQQTLEENNARPDLVGKDNEGVDVLFCEMKFYAGLTQNQPLTYIKSLKSNGGKGLIFVCPKLRETSLFAKLKEICAENNCNIEEINNRLCVVDGVAMGIITWGEILDELERVCYSNDKELHADVLQLKGLCEYMDMDRFIPFSSEELCAETARKIERYYTVVDKTVDLILADKNVCTLKEGKSTSYYNGYEKKIKIDKYILHINTDRYLWKDNSTVETPFWCSFNTEDYEDTDEMISVLEKIDVHKKNSTCYGLNYLALVPPVDATLDEVCEELKRQILCYLELFKNS